MVEKTFIDEYDDEISDTIYLTANPHSAETISEEDFFMLDEVWRYDWDDDLGTVLAETITDRAIALGRKYPEKRLLIHYNQPHVPFVNDPDICLTKDTDNFFNHDGFSAFGKLDRGLEKKSRVWDAYRDNLDYALEEVERLFRNHDAEKAVVTSDHGNAFGEWGVYGHPHGMPLHCLRMVPWIETTATDSEEDSGASKSDESVDVDIEQRLQSLGYR